MKKREHIRDLLGLTQLELATLLHISREQYTMFELGHRPLPAGATVLLAEMLHHVQTIKITPENSKVMQQQYTQTQLQLERMLKENEYQQLLIARKISAAEKSYTNKLKATQLVEFLLLRANNKDAGELAALRSISNKAIKSLKQNGLVTLTRLKLKLDVLELEKLLLEAKLRKMVSAIEITGTDD